MATIDISRIHNLGVDGAKAKVLEIEPKLDEKFGVTLRWRGYEADLEGKGVSGVVRVADSTLILKVKLGLWLRPLSGKIKSGIEQALDKSFAA